MENFVDLRLSAEEAELIDFALDLVVDAYGRNLEQMKILNYFVSVNMASIFLCLIKFM